MKYLRLNGVGTYTYRRDVPPALQDAVGSRVLSRSLDTRDPAEAALRWPQAHAWAQAILDKAKRQATPVSDADVDNAGRSFLRDRLDQLKAEVSPLEGAGDDGGEADGPVYVEFGNPEWRQAQIAEAVEKAGLPVRKGGPNWNKLEAKMIDALDDSLIAESGLIAGRQVHFTIRERADITPTVGDMVEKWIASRGDISDKRNSEARRAAFLIGKAKRISTVTKSVVLKFRDDRLEAEARPSTIKKYLSFLSSAFALYIEPMENPPTNPFKGIALPEDDSDEERRAWLDIELASLLSLPEFEAPENNEKGASIFWITLLALFIGARQSELVQLDKQDVHDDTNVLVIDIHRGRGGKKKKIKNKHSIRKVPVPQVLLDIGFKEYVESCGGRLFDIPADSHGTPGGTFSKWVARIIDRTSKDPELVFHGLRHTFIQRAYHAELRPDYIDAIVGHRDRRVTNQHYGLRLGLNMEALKREIDKVSFSIDVAKLKTAAVVLQKRSREQI